jgi:hypothetical protein
LWLIVAGGFASPAFAAGIGKVVGTEAGYGYLVSAEGLAPDSGHALIAGLYFGYLIGDRPRSSTLLSLLVDYGLLFNLLLQEGREGYAFGHHTRLGLGPVFRLGGRNELALRVAYNFVTFPYFELATARLRYPSLALRYQRRL